MHDSSCDNPPTSGVCPTESLPQQPDVFTNVRDDVLGSGLEGPLARLVAECTPPAVQEPPADDARCGSDAGVSSVSPMGDDMSEQTSEQSYAGGQADCLAPRGRSSAQADPELFVLSIARAMDFAMPGLDPDQDDVDTVRCRLARSQSRLLPFLTVADICRLATVSYQHLLDTRVGIDEPGHLDRLFPEVQPQHAAGWHSPNQRGRRREEDEGQEDDEAEDGSMKRGEMQDK
mmetsp:Transcript_105152/g.336495  ORF Transcript_105152/g.336495 Transcript_105152/m.336495 type:complete len:232 (-) Transcript_105152:133-828(-)